MIDTKYIQNIEGLNKFRRAMFIKLESNEEEKEDSWATCDINYLETALLDEIEEYKESIRKEAKASELVDIANFCMMLYNRHTEKR